MSSVTTLRRSGYSRLGALVVVAIGVASAAPNFAEAQPPTSASEYQAAQEAFRAGDFDEAVRRLERAYALEPKAIYVYNMGRALESSGRWALAFEAYLRTQAVADVSPEIKSLAAAKADGVRPLKDKAALHLSGVAVGSVVHLGTELVPSGVAVAPADAGRHVLCVIPPDGRHPRCAVVQLQRGSVQPWPPVQCAWQAVKNDLGPSLERVRLDGVGFQGRIGPVQAFELCDVTALEVDVRVGERTETWRGNARRHLLGTLAPPVTARESIETTSPAPSADASSQVGPWVTIGVGGAVSVVGLALATHAVVAAQEDTGGTQAEAAEAWEAAQRREVAGWALAGVGAAAVAGGLVWLLSPTEDDTLPVGPTVVPTSNGALFGARGRF
jgi:hypothetical protein